MRGTTWMSLALLFPALWGVLAAASIEAAQAQPAASGSRVKAAVDSMLRKEAARGDTGDGAEADEEAEEESASPPSGGDSRPGLPFELKKPVRKDVQDFQLAVVRAVNAMEKGSHGRAARMLEGTAPTERLAQVYRTLLLADAYEGQGEFDRADSVLRACLGWVGGSVWRNHLLDRRIRIFAKTSPSDSARLDFYTQAIQASVPRGAKVDFLYELLALQGFTGSPAGHEDLLERLVDLAPGDKRLDTLYRKLLPFAPHGQGDWKVQNILLEAEGKLGLLDEAVKRSEAMLPLVPGKAEKRKLHWNFVSLHYRQKEYRKAIPLYEKYIERYGDSPDAYLQIARSYDRLGESRKSLLWYEKFLEKYPRHSKASEIYWLRGWEFEQQGRYEEAIEQYFRQHADFRTNRRGDWANFRIGLCHYKAGNFAAALQSFKAIRSQENSSAFSAGLYWEGAALEAMKDSAAARAAFVETYLAYPFQFYGHLARQALEERGAWADSLEPGTRFAPSSAEGIRKWMKEGMSGYSERITSDFESEYLGLGKLLQFKLDSLAILTLRTIPGRVKNNPLFLYVYARKFRDRQLWRESYRLGLQLSYRIPETRWGSAPREVLRLIYPRPYEGLVQKFSAKRGLDPGLVFALMRQESGFDRKIRSSAGALGLMQIMPATGRTLARQEGLSGFETAMLTDAESNILLGTAYLRDLKKDFKGNSYFVLANYNAGPGPARRWLREHGDKPLAMMVEDISYWETRGYVKKVMGNYWTYDILWNKSSKAGSRETVAR